MNKESRGGGRATEGGSRHLKSTRDQEPSSQNVILALPKVDDYNIFPYPCKIPHSTHPSTKKSPAGPAPRRVGVAAREGTSGLWAGVSVRHSSVDREFQGWEPRGVGKSSHRRKRRRNGVGVESPLPKMNSPAPATFWPRERK